MQTETHTTETPRARRPVLPHHGVDTPALFATIGAVDGNRGLAAFQFRATNTWIRGTHSRTEIDGFFGAGSEMRHARPFTVDADHPGVLTGADEGMLPVELLLAALASCLTAGIANVAAARGVELARVSSTVEGDIDLQGILGLSGEVRNGFQGIRITFSIDGDASDEVLAGIVAQSRARSAVFDVLTNGVPVDVRVAAR